LVRIIGLSACLNRQWWEAIMRKITAESLLSWNLGWNITMTFFSCPNLFGWGLDASSWSGLEFL
jgi:hypothetical protein